MAAIRGDMLPCHATAVTFRYSCRCVKERRLAAGVARERHTKTQQEVVDVVAMPRRDAACLPRRRTRARRRHAVESQAMRRADITLMRWHTSSAEEVVTYACLSRTPRHDAEQPRLMIRRSSPPLLQHTPAARAHARHTPRC